MCFASDSDIITCEELHLIDSDERIQKFAFQEETWAITRRACVLDRSLIHEWLCCRQWWAILAFLISLSLIKSIMHSFHITAFSRHDIDEAIASLWAKFYISTIQLHTSLSRMERVSNWAMRSRIIAIRRHIHHFTFLAFRRLNERCGIRWCQIHLLLILRNHKQVLKLVVIVLSLLECPLAPK